jgi:hypothetical protein
LIELVRLIAENAVNVEDSGSLKIYNVCLETWARLKRRKNSTESII